LLSSSGEEVVKVEEELIGFSPDKDTVLTVGVFDGVHLGHKRLITELLHKASKDNYLAVVVTFRQHPEDLLSKSPKLPFLTDIQTRTRLLKKAGVDIVVPLSFTTELASLEARCFVELLMKYLKMRGLVIGPDFALGKDRTGDTKNLTELGKNMDFDVTVVPPLVINNEIVSSTTIRKAMADGDMEKYRKFTGRSFNLHGKVVTGSGRGGGLGFPTANLNVRGGQAVPPDGVYAGWAHVNGKIYQTMTNVGLCPTFEATERTIEAYLLDYNGDLYGHELTVDFIAKLRDEKKFDNEDDLKAQVEIDIRKGKEILSAVGAN
jgi:riboflavin kinase/FMN adenylyltransferase